MPPRGRGIQGFQLGVETTPGTGVAANKKFTDLMLVPGPEVNAEAVHSTGYLMPTGVQVTQEWASADVTGKLGFNGLVYVLSSLFGAAAITTPGGGTNSRDWTWASITGKAVTVPKTYTLEYGDAVRAYKAVHAFFNSLGISLDRTKVDFSSSVLAQQLQTGITLTGSPTEIANQVAMPNQFDVYADDTGAGIGTTKLLAAYEAALNIGDRFVVDWPINSANASFSSYVDSESQEHTSSLKLAADATGDAMFSTTFRAGAKKFIRLKATGPIIEAAIPYLIQLDFCALITKPGKFESFNGVEVMPFDFVIAYDATWGKAMSVKVTNLLIAL